MKKHLFSAILTMISIVTINAQIVKTQVGLTKYDLQTNNSIERRVVVDPNTSELVVTYTGSMDLDPGSGSFANRGTGYYYYSGTGALSPQTSFPGRIEGTVDRTGWPNPIFLPGNNEAIVSHRAASSSGSVGLSFAKRVKGTSTWNFSSVSTADLTWPRMANTGDSIFVISSTLSGNINGMSGGIGFLRSYNGGSTWTPTTGVDTIPGINQNNYPNVGTANVLGGDEYSLDVKGQTVAILTGATDVTLHYSYDFGTTWNKKTLIVGDNVTTDTIAQDNRSSGDYSVLIDNNGKIHCFWGLLYGSNMVNTTAKAGIMYWNEYMGTAKPKLINKTMYEKEAGAHALISLPFFTTLFTGQNNNQTGYGSAHTSQPSTGIDASGNIYLSYMRLRGISDTNRFLAGLNTDATNMLLNDCYLMKSLDSGKTWIGPINISSSDSMESAFPSIARHVDGFVHMVYQEDPLYGFAISSTGPGHNGATSDNKIIYAKIPVADIVSPTDITPPILRFHDSFVEKTKLTTFNEDTFIFYNNCPKELRSGLVWTNPLSFATSNLVWGMDNVDEGNVIYLDTPDGIKMNVAGVYRYKIYAKDAAGNVCSSSFTAGGSEDTLTFYIRVIITDVTPPTISLNKRTDYIYKGTSYTLPSGNATVSDDNPCGGSPNVTLPTASQVDVNVPGIYNLVYTVKDAANNTSTDTLKVYVGKEPLPVITDESVNTSTKKITAKGDQTQDIYTWAPTTYAWKVKKATATITLAGATTQNLTGYSIPTSVTSFDSLCLEASNLFNAAPHSKSKVLTCKYLKYTVGIQSASNDVNIEVFPNPNNGAFNIKVNGNKSNQARVILTNMEGRTLVDNTYKISNSEIPFNSNLSKGTYFMTTEIDGNVYLDKVEVK